MDEITLDDKVYVSSKRAAKITGYAKDYVGQLCREGRVEARLVGRNWYVLESSIREHRFGSEQKHPSNGTISGEDHEQLATWMPSQYSSEVVPELPVRTVQMPVVLPASEEIQEIQPLAAVPAPLAPDSSDILASQNVVKEMQSAWHDWFSRTNELEVSEELLIEAPVEEDYLPEGEEERSTEDDTSSYDAPGESFDGEVTPITLEKITEVIEELESPTAPAGIEEEEYEEVVPIKRSYRAPEPAQMPPTPQAPSMLRRREAVVQPDSYAEGRVVTERVVRKAQRVQKSQKPSNALRTVFISVSLLALIVTAIATGKLDSLFAREHLNYGPINYLGGQSSVKKVN